MMMPMVGGACWAVCGVVCSATMCPVRAGSGWRWFAAPLRESVYPSVGHDGRIAQHPGRGPRVSAAPMPHACGRCRGWARAALQELPRDAPIGCRVHPARRTELPALLHHGWRSGCRGRASGGQGCVGRVGQSCRNFRATRQSDAACTRRVGRTFLHPCTTRGAADAAGVPAGGRGASGESDRAAGTSARRADRMPREPGASDGTSCVAASWVAQRMPRAYRSGRPAWRAHDEVRPGGVSRGAAWTRAARPRCARRLRSRHPRRRGRAAARGARAPRGGRAPW